MPNIGESMSENRINSRLQQEDEPVLMEAAKAIHDAIKDRLPTMIGQVLAGKEMKSRIDRLLGQAVHDAFTDFNAQADARIEAIEANFDARIDELKAGFAEQIDIIKTAISKLLNLPSPIVNVSVPENAIKVEAGHVTVPKD